VPRHSIFVYAENLSFSDGAGPSGEGSYGIWADHYVTVVSALIEQHAIRSILDLGTGDFNIGSRLRPLVDRCTPARSPC